jgi:hypothetical protein
MEEGGTDLIAIEQEVLGIDHAALGGLYLAQHGLPEMLIAATRHHHAPAAAGENKFAAAVQVADLLVRRANIGKSGNANVSEEDCRQAEGWASLVSSEDHQERLTRALDRTLSGLPAMLEVLV